jgi:hypothetical protein
VISANLNGVVASNVVRLHHEPVGRGTHERLQYIAKDQPWFRLGHGVVLLNTLIGTSPSPHTVCSLAQTAVGLVGSVAYQAILRRENGLRDAGHRDEVIEAEIETLQGAGVEERAQRNGRFATVDEARRIKGDAWSGYRYML